MSVLDSGCRLDSLPNPRRMRRYRSEIIHVRETVASEITLVDGSAYYSLYYTGAREPS